MLILMAVRGSKLSTRTRCGFPLSEFLKYFYIASDLMNKVDENSVHISVFTMPKFPDSNCHKKIKRSPNWCKNPIWWVKRGFDN